MIEDFSGQTPEFHFSFSSEETPSFEFQDTDTNLSLLI